MSTTPQRHVILTAIAFDETSEPALWEAARQAQFHENTELHVVHVAPGIPDSGASADAVRPIADALKSRIEAIQLQRPQKVIAHVRAGAAARVILQTAADIDADLLIVGTHKRVGLERLVLGSVAERVLRDAHCPVLVAMPKDYLRAGQSDTIEPVCQDCAIARQASSNASYWCERHARSRPRPHVYEPSSSRHPGPLEL